MKLFSKLSIFISLTIAFFLLPLSNALAFGGHTTYIPQNSLALDSPTTCPTDAYDFYVDQSTPSVNFGANIATYGSFTASQLPNTITFSPGVQSTLTVGQTYYVHVLCDSNNSQEDIISFVYAPAPTDTPVPNSYHMTTLEITTIGDMTSGSTGSFFSTFSHNWPSLVGFGIGILALFFFWRLILKFLKSRGGVR